MLVETTPYARSLGNGLTLKSIRDLEDAERLAAFNKQIFGEGVAAMTRALIVHHPATRPEHWLYVEDEATGQVVSSLALIPWHWCYEEVQLSSGEMAIVGTLDSYRNRGLVRALAARHRELLQDGGFDFSHIQGIPYFYRQFGYEYALPLEPKWQLELRDIPAAPDEAAAYHFRPATEDDVPVLMRLYEAATAGLQVSACRDEAIWRFMLACTAGTELEAEIWLMLDASDAITGYCRIAHYGFGTGLIVSETSRLNHTTAKVLLTWLKSLAIDREKPYVRLNLPVTNDLLQAAKSWGAYDAGTYAWQILLVDAARLLCKLAPVLERRIASSMFAGLSQTLVINLYRAAFELHFEAGKLLSVHAIGFCDQGAIRIPPTLLAPLLLGYRSREELARMYPDFAIYGEFQQLIDVLFPKRDSFLFTIY